jgi:hypothetical protein
MKSEIHAAYVAGLCPLQILMRHGPDSHRQVLPTTAGDEPSLDLPHTSLPRKRALLFVLVLGLAIGAWQLLSGRDEVSAAADPTQGSASGKSVLLLLLIVGLTLGAGEFLSRIGERPAAAVAAQSSASGQSARSA